MMDNLWLENKGDWGKDPVQGLVTTKMGPMGFKFS